MEKLLELADRCERCDQPIRHSGLCAACIADDMDCDDHDCWNCGGEGYVSDCFEEYACLHPDDGCELCMERCEFCNPHHPKEQPK